MVTVSRQTSKSRIALGKQRNYHEIVEFLDKHWALHRGEKNLERIKKLDAALNSPSKDLNAILVAGVNGKGLTIHFAIKLLKEEGFTVGAYYAPHVLTYNERFVINQETISNKVFTDIGNEVINASEQENIDANSAELLAAMSFLYFKQNHVDVALFEVATGNQWDPVAMCDTKVLGITRLTAHDAATLEACIKETAYIAKKDSWVVCADQSKSNLQSISTIVQQQQAHWAMPIRKLASLAYPFEQLHGRCAALAERIAQLYVEKFITPEATVISNSLLTKPKGQRGRPTREAKQQSQLNPKRTLEQFWKEELSTLPARFQLLEKEKPSVLLDNASNIDAFKNLLLGIRLIHYQRPLKGLAIIVGAHKNSIEGEEFLKLIRYFFKKTSGSIIFCPIQDLIPGPVAHTSLDIEKILNEVKNLKIKAKATKDFAEAFEAAKKSVDERHGLIVVTGSHTIINEYWNYKGIKKL